jgi:hypothetical protein
MKPKPQEKTKKATDHPTQRHWREMNRKQRRETMRKIQSEDISLEVVHPDAAGIDIGNESHYVAVPPSRNSQPVRRFGCTTAELKAMADWLKQCGIRTVAMPGIANDLSMVCETHGRRACSVNVNGARFQSHGMARDFRVFSF